MSQKEHQTTEPSWAIGEPWYLMPSKYERFLQEVGLSENHYLEAMKELGTLMPLNKARSYTKNLLFAQGGILPESLHPSSFSVLDHHPLKIFLSGMPSDTWHLADAVRLGRDLMESCNITGMQSLRKRLPSLEEYAGVLFEVELLAELCRAKLENVRINKNTPDFEARLGRLNFLIEARHRGVSVARAITQKIIFGLHLNEFGKLKITLKPGIGNAVQIRQLVERIARDARSLVSGEPGPLERAEYLLAYDPDLGPRAVSIQYGGNTESYSDIVFGLVHGALMEKEKKFLKRRVDENEVAIVALDLRTQFPATPMLEKYTNTPYINNWLKKNMPRLGAWHKSALASAVKFVKSSNVLSGALLWLPNNGRAWPCTPLEYYNAPHTMTLITKRVTIPIVGSGDLKRALESAFF